MSSFSPIKKRSYTASEIEALSDDDSIPEYQPIERVRKERVGQLRGRVGVEELAQIVGSRNYRDVKRSANFMPGQFETWNTKNGGKYWGDYQDVDGDEINEFVVRRKDKNGPMIAVNGYTTKRSDWGARELYYRDNPTRESRSKNGPLKKYIRSYYSPTYDDTGKITKWGIKPGSDADPLHDKIYDRYIKYTPKDLSPYQAIQKYIFTPAFKAYLQESNMTRNKFIDDFGFGSIATSASNVYNRLVKDVIYAKLVRTNKALLEGFAQDYIIIRQRKDPGYDQSADDFTDGLINYLFTRKDIKAMAAEYVNHILLNPAAKIGEAKAIIAEDVEAAKAAKAARDGDEIL